MTGVCIAWTGAARVDCSVEMNKTRAAATLADFKVDLGQLSLPITKEETPSTPTPNADYIKKVCDAMRKVSFALHCSTDQTCEYRGCLGSALSLPWHGAPVVPTKCPSQCCVFFYSMKRAPHQVCRRLLQTALMPTQRKTEAALTARPQWITGRRHSATLVDCLPLITIKQTCTRTRGMCLSSLSTTLARPRSWTVHTLPAQHRLEALQPRRI